jgi:Mn2+/Fe2+ NRAMP family transporter
LMFLVMHMSGNRRVVGQFRLPRYLSLTGWIATITMLLASLGFLAGTILGGL